MPVHAPPHQPRDPVTLCATVTQNLYSHDVLAVENRVWLGLTEQKPLQRAYQRDPEAIETWQRERVPAIARQAKASGGEV
jgi:hypothetical protein